MGIVLDAALGRYQGKQSGETASFSPNYRRWDRRACAIDERAAPLPSEYVILKEYASAFAGTQLK